MVNTLFNINNAVVMPFWFLMIVLPTWKWTKRIMQSPFVAVTTAIIYVVLLVYSFTLESEVGLEAMSSLEGVAMLLSTPIGAAIAWAHFVTFDLLVGRWEYLESRERGINPFLMAPVLFFTLMLGPVGFVMYLILWTFYKKPE